MFIPSRHFSPFKLFLDRETHMALMLNPKVMTTFTRHFLTDGFREFRSRADPSEGRYRLLQVPRRFPVARLRDYAGFLLAPDRYALFAFSRNPYARLASAWRNKFFDGHHRSPDHRDEAYARSIRKHHIARIRAFAAEQGLAGAAPASLVPFATFLRYAAARPEGQRDHHWDSQSSVLMTDRLRYTRIFRIEDELNEGFMTFARPLGFSEDWVTDRLARPRNPSKSSEPVYDKDSAALARLLVGNDLARFGYAEDSWQGQ
jgi:hypothetical protein